MYNLYKLLSKYVKGYMVWLYYLQSKQLYNQVVKVNVFIIIIIEIKHTILVLNLSFTSVHNYFLKIYLFIPYNFQPILFIIIISY